MREENNEKVEDYVAEAVAEHNVDQSKPLDVVAEAETLLAYAAIAEQHTKEELVAKSLESFRITAHLIDLLRVLSVDRDGLSATQRVMYDTASATALRAKTRRAAKYVVAQYDANIASAADANKHGAETDTTADEQ